ncbi:exo-alpha-sialidase [Plantactinospora mayteni]|uniref:exo-alpha-sialidase n=1 Tax=Plantactinospora mayteni TaxID=566021 RepID=A0ABQ4EVI0_9ACTN|nr:sialidase family protein [Plantactinospora mayteni]GIG98672.1 neuramidase [Plantactinospora mayteni]
MRSTHPPKTVHYGVARLTTIVLLAAGGLAVLPASGSARPAGSAAGVAPLATVDPFAARTTTLFTTGKSAQEDPCYRIPAIVRTKAGSLLAFASHRIKTCLDKSNTQIVVRRLPAGATVWEPELSVLRGTPEDPEAAATRGNSAPVVYRTLPGAPVTAVPDGRVVLLSTYNWVDPAHDGDSHHGQPRTPYVQYSDDDGRTWSTARSLLDQIDDPSWGHYATGPVHAIQLQRGPHAGRLVVGVNYGAPGSVSGAMIAYSDDGGTTWQKGARREYPAEARTKPQEMSLVELANGDLYVWARQNWTPEPIDDPEFDVNQRPHRLFAISKNGGQSYTADGFQPVTGFETHRVESASLRLRATDEGDAYNRILTSAPAWNNSRRAMTVRSSFDEGRTWQTVDTVASDSTDEGRQVWGTANRGASKDECACYAGYSDLVELADGGVGLLYERGVNSYHDEIVFVRLTETDLHTPATTPDTAGGRSALVFHGATPSSAGRFGGGINFDGISGRVQLPYRTTPVLGPGDFTVSVWFRYGESTAPQAIFWAYGQNTTPQVWIRGEPADNKIQASVRPAGATAGISVASAGAYNDRAWHHLVLRRQGDTLSLMVDGIQVGTTTGTAGTIAGAEPMPIYLGQRLDGAHRFDGRMDELRVYDRALTDAELSRLRLDNALDIPGLTAHLPMD